MPGTIVQVIYLSNRDLLSRRPVNPACVDQNYLRVNSFVTAFPLFYHRGIHDCAACKYIELLVVGISHGIDQVEGGTSELIGHDVSAVTEILHGWFIVLVSRDSIERIFRHPLSGRIGSGAMAAHRTATTCTIRE